MIKWFGTHVYSLISRFRNQVYLEEVASSSDTQVLVRNASTGLVTYNSSAGGSAYRYHWHNISYFSTSSGYVWLPNNNSTTEAASGAYYSRIVAPYTGKVVKVVSKTVDTANRTIAIDFFKNDSGTDLGPASGSIGTTLTRASGIDAVAGTFNINTTSNNWNFSAGDCLYFRRRDNISGGPQDVNMTIIFQYSI